MADEPRQSQVFGTAANPDPSKLSHGEDNLTPLAQLRRMQKVLFHDVINDQTEPRFRAQIACAWERLEGRKAALTMRPAPKPVEVPAPGQRRKRHDAQSSGPADPGA